MSLVATTLRHVADLTEVITANVVHPEYFPFRLNLVLHAARVSMGYQFMVKKTGNWRTIPWLTYIAGFLIMCWGGGVWCHLLMGLYPPQVYVAQLWIGYISVHLLLTIFFSFFPRLLNPAILDTILIPIDTILRTGSITSAQDLISTHPDPRIQSSVFLRLVLGAVASAGGGVSAASIQAWTPEWSWSTPPFLKGGLLATADIWGGMLAAFTYGLLQASHPLYQDLLLSSSITTQKGPLLTPLGARSVATLVLGVVFVWKVFMLHWAGSLWKKAGSGKPGSGAGRPKMKMQ